METAPEHKAVTFLQRPGLGNEGRRLSVKTNYFALTSLPQADVHHYDVSITPEKCPIELYRRVFKCCLESNKSKFKNILPVYDGRANAYTPKELPFRSESFTVVLPEEGGGPPNPKRPPREFRVKMRWVNNINMEQVAEYMRGRTQLNPNILTGIMAIDVVLRNQPSFKLATHGRCFYGQTDSVSLGGGADVWPGMFLSARAGPGKLLLNLDVSATAFFKSGPLIHFAGEILQARGPGDFRGGIQERQHRQLEKACRNLKIFVTHRGEKKPKYKIAKLSREPASRLTFQDSDGNSKSVAQYFQEHHNIRLEFPNMPCVTTGKGNQIPMEVCQIVPGQRFGSKLNETQTSNMIKFTCQPPDRRAQKIMNNLNMLNFRENPDFRAFNMQLDERMMDVAARVLPTPTVCYNASARDSTCQPRDGVWNMIGKKVSRGMELRSWGVVSFCGERFCPPAQVQGFVRELAITCQDTGMNIVEKQPPIYLANPQGDVEQQLRQHYQSTGNRFQARPQLLVCILPNTGVPLYAEIKRVSDTVLGIATQCVQVKHTKMPKKQYCANVCLKMNVKIGGANSFIAPREMPFLSEMPTIVMGGDVTHPPPGDVRRPSIASLVGSMDSNGSRFASTVRVQGSRVENIVDLGTMTKEILRCFYQATGKKPNRILFYRDGVSEGQFSTVLENEMKAIQTACSELEPGYRPKITWIVVQKRHHTRFFPLNKQQADRSGNCLAGTLVESEITHPTEFDFYLQSHAGLQGTSRPTHYHVLHDENKFTPDGLQSLTYKLCYLFCRATRAVRVVPVVYYADIMCERARFHAKGENWSDTASTDSGKSDTAYARVVPELQNVMYFM